MARDVIAQGREVWQSPQETSSHVLPPSPTEALKPLARYRTACVNLLKQRRPLDDQRIKDEALTEGIKVYYDSSYLRVMISGSNVIIHAYDSSQWQKNQPRFALTLAAGRVYVHPQDVTMKMIRLLPVEFFDELSKLGDPFAKIVRALAGR